MHTNSTYMYSFCTFYLHLCKDKGSCFSSFLYDLDRFIIYTFHLCCSSIDRVLNTQQLSTKDFLAFALLAALGAAHTTPGGEGPQGVGHQA